MSKKFNRLVALCAFFLLVGWVAWLDGENTAAIIAAAAAPLATYIGVKGPNSGES